MRDEADDGLRRTFRLRFVEREETELVSEHPAIRRGVVRKVLQQRYDSIYVDGQSIWVDVPLEDESV